MKASGTGSRWIEFDDIGYPDYHKLDLSGGNNTNEYTYIAPNGLAVVKSSAERWQSGDYYYLSNLFDGSLYYRTHGNDHRYSYWLGQCSSPEVATITITFDSPQDISHIVIEPQIIPNYNDGRSWYAIDGYHDAADLQQGNIKEAVHITQMINTDSDNFGKVHGHTVKGKYEALVIYLWKIATGSNIGNKCVLNEIEIFVANPATCDCV